MYCYRSATNPWGLECMNSSNKLFNFNYVHNKSHECSMAQKVSTVYFQHQAFLEKTKLSRKLEEGTQEFQAKEALQLKK